MSYWSSDVCSSDLPARQWLADNLQPKGKSLSVQTAGHRHGRKARQRCGHREHGIQLHGERISWLFTRGESGHGRRGRQQQVDRKRAGWGKRLSVREDLVGGRIIKQQKIK